MASVLCELCGERTYVNLLKDHQATDFCKRKSLQHGMQKKEKKWTFIDNRYLLDDIGIPYEVGYFTTGGDTLKVLWIDEWVARILILSQRDIRRSEDEWLVGNRASILKFISKHQEIADMIETLYKLGGPSAVTKALREAMNNV